MQHRSPRAAAVGVDLGTVNTTVSIRGRGERPDLRILDGVPTGDPEAAAVALAAVFERVRAFRDDAVGGSAPLAVAAPVSWERDRYREIADAAEAAGLGRPAFVPSAEAAAVYVEARGHELEPGAALIVYSLGAGGCEVGVVRRDEDGRTVLAAHGAHGVGGDEFDHLVLAYLSGRHGDDDRGFWDRVDGTDPAEAALRPALLQEIRRARERLSEHASADVALPEAGLGLQLTQQELESCIGELVEQTCELAAAVMEAAGVGADEASGLLMTGGASRTPLVVARLTERTGLKPVLPDHPEHVAAEGAALAALPEAPVETGAPRLRRTAVRAGVLAALLVVLVGGTAIFGSELGTGESRQPPLGASTSTTPPGETASPSEGEAGSGGAGGALEGNPQSQSPDESEEASEAEPSDGGQAPSPTEDGREESATAGSVPDVTSMSSQDAEETLADAGFTNVDFEGEPDPLFGPWYDDCVVKEQDPEPETQLAFDELVTVTYSGTEADGCEE